MKKNLPKELRRGRPVYKYAPAVADGPMRRQRTRAGLFRQRFEPMNGNHIRPIGAPLRAERRRIARAFAAGAWNKIKVVI